MPVTALAAATAGCKDTLRFQDVPCDRRSCGSWWRGRARPSRECPCARRGTAHRVGVENAAPASTKDRREAFLHGLQVNFLRRREDEAADVLRDPATFEDFRRDAEILDAAVRARADDDLIDPEAFRLVDRFVFDGDAGNETVGLTLARSISITRSYSASRSASYMTGARWPCSFKYLRATLSTGICRFSRRPRSPCSRS